MRRGLLLMVAVALLRAPMAARAWNHTGHMVVAQIAYLRLTPAAKARVDQLGKIAAMPRTNTFVTAACWPDDLRSADNYYNEWHYIDRPFSPDGTALPTEMPQENVQWAIQQCVKTLKSKKTSDKEKARALRFLLHFVGDVHMPLHCTSRYTAEQQQGDAGGNGFKITAGESKNLHHFWDSALGLLGEVKRPLNADGEAAILALANGILGDNPPESLPEWKERKVEKWVDEGFALARTVVYEGITEGQAPSAEYVARGRTLARKRLALAGYRLAELLNDVLE